MTEEVSGAAAGNHDHLSWVRTRMTLDGELMEWIRHGFALITVGFGSFAFLEGVTGALGERGSASGTEPSRIFSLVATAIGVVLIALALKHNRSMVAFVNSDAFGAAAAPELPNEKREEYLAAGAIVLGLISFVALLAIR